MTTGIWKCKKEVIDNLSIVLSKQGKVTINGKPSDTLSQFLLNNIFKQAGWK